MALLDDVLDAHAGMDAWRRLHHFTAHMSFGGPLFVRCGQAGAMKDIVVEGFTQQQSVQFANFTAPDRRGLYRPDWVGIENLDGEILLERNNPREALRGRDKNAPWDDLDLAYIFGAASWNYLTAPFLFAGPGFHAEELSPWQENGETWRRLRVLFPADIATHCPEQIFYFDQAGLQRRMDYHHASVDGPRMAQYSWAHQKFSGIVLPTLRQVMGVGPDGRVMPKPVLVNVEIFDASFA